MYSAQIAQQVAVELMQKVSVQQEGASGVTQPVTFSAHLHLVQFIPPKMVKEGTQLNLKINMSLTLISIQSLTTFNKWTTLSTAFQIKGLLIDSASNQYTLKKEILFIITVAAYP